MPSASDGAAYLDTSAFVKWIIDESESEAFRAEIDRWPRLVASGLLALEALRFGARVGGDAYDAATDRLKRIDQAAIDEDVVRSATRVPPPHLRSLDAIHLATALRVRDEVGAFFTYDLRLAAAAREHGFDVRSPGAEGVPPQG